MHLYPVSGAAARPANSDTAWAYRDAGWVQVMVGVDPDPAKADELRDWTVGYWEALHPYSMGGGYVNMMMDEGQERVRATYREQLRPPCGHQVDVRPGQPVPRQPEHPTLEVDTCCLRLRSDGTIGSMPRYLVERTYTVDMDTLPTVATRSKAIGHHRFPEIVWEHSHVVVGSDGVPKSFCVYDAPSEDVVREHSKAVGRSLRRDDLGDRRRRLTRGLPAHDPPPE